MLAAGLPDQELPAAALYVVGLPIGNMGDITLRALWVLLSVDAVAAEDTRETRKLLERFGIDTRLLSVREHNERHGAEQIDALLAEGQRVALVTVEYLRRVGRRVIPVPGASAAITALSAAGLLGTGFDFIGFLPPQPKARHQSAEELAHRKRPFVLYEAPHRILALLEDLGAALTPERRIVVARELTKKFETITSLTAADLSEWIKTHEPRGEYVVLVDEEPMKEETLSVQEEAWLKALAPELPSSRLAAIAAKLTGPPRQEIYTWLTVMRKAQETDAAE